MCRIVFPSLESNSAVSKELTSIYIYICRVVFPSLESNSAVSKELTSIYIYIYIYICRVVFPSLESNSAVSKELTSIYIYICRIVFPSLESNSAVSKELTSIYIYIYIYVALSSLVWRVTVPCRRSWLVYIYIYIYVALSSLVWRVTVPCRRSWLVYIYIYIYIYRVVFPSLESNSAVSKELTSIYIYICRVVFPSLESNSAVSKELTSIYIYICRIVFPSLESNSAVSHPDAAQTGTFLSAVWLLRSPGAQVDESLYHQQRTWEWDTCDHTRRGRLIVKLKSLLNVHTTYIIIVHTYGVMWGSSMYHTQSKHAQNISFVVKNGILHIVQIIRRRAE